MSKKKLESKPEVPDIQTCPNCGNPIFLGDKVCQVCGHNMQSTADRFKEQPPIVISVAAFVIGILITFAAFGMENPWQTIVGLIGVGTVIGGGLYYALHLMLTGDSRREKIKQYRWWRFWDHWRDFE